MGERLLKYRLFLIVPMHGLLIITSYFLAFASRLDISFYNSNVYHWIFISTLIPLLAIRLLSYWYFDLFQGLWRYVGLKDLKDIIKASLLGTMLFALYIFIVMRGEGFPRSILLIDFTYNIILAGGIRMIVRIFREETIKFSIKNLPDSKNVLIVGAGSAGEMILREMRNNPRLGYNPVGFVDDDSSKLKARIHGVSVLGSTSELVNIVAQYEVKEVIIAIPSAKGKTIRKIVSTCKTAGIRFKTLPYIGDLINSNVNVSLIRDVAIEDLLGRDAVSLDMSLIGQQLANKVIMVTGAAGSIGSEIVSQLARFYPQKVILFERAENDLFHLELELKKRKLPTVFIPFIGDIRDEDRVRECFETYHPSHIFHAAAYKHVPMMEGNPLEAVKNNIFGTRVLADIASDYNVDKFVLISTDKAVSPTNVMGATKRVAELILQEKSKTNNCKTQFIAVRFGNVLGSNGSVIPLFKKQIEEGGPVTITHPDITRYFMTVSEAVQLVIQAGAMGRGGEIFILEMGEAVKIRELAENLIYLSGLTPGDDIEIIYTSLRPGEKICEELLVSGENVIKTDHDKIWVLNHKNEESEKLLINLKNLDTLGKVHSSSDIKSILKEIVPEYEPYFPPSSP